MGAGLFGVGPSVAVPILVTILSQTGINSLWKGTGPLVQHSVRGEDGRCHEDGDANYDEETLKRSQARG